MDALAVLKQACVKTTFKSFKNMQPGEYIVTSFEKCTTDHGERVRVTVEDYYLLLPGRFNTMLTQEIIDELNKSPKIMIYGGKDASARDRLILDFKDATYFSDMFAGAELFP